MDAFLITFREGLEAALIVAVIVGVLGRTGRSDLVGWAWAGVAAAVGASAIAATTLSVMGIEAESPAIEGIAYLVGAAMIGTLVVWMVRKGGAVAGEVERGISSRADLAGPAASIGVAVFAFFMVGREGVETALFLGAAALGQDPVAQTIGALAGLAAAIGLAALLVRGMAHVDLRLFFTVTAVALGVLALKFAGSGVRELAEAGILALPETAEGVLALLVAGPGGLLVTLGATLAPVIVVLLGLLGGRPREAPQG